MSNEGAVRAFAHRQNIDRYRTLLRTKLTDLEQNFIQKRLVEEEAAIRRLSAGFDYRRQLAAVSGC